MVFADTGQIEVTDISVAPNRSYIAVVKSQNNGDTITILDPKTGKIDYEHVTLPVIRVIWSKDAESLAICEHVAGGSQVVILSHSGSGWVRTEYDPPPSDDNAEGIQKYGVIQMSDTGKSWRVRYLREGATAA